jgi:hypothetical protein
MCRPNLSWDHINCGRIYVCIATCWRGCRGFLAYILVELWSLTANSLVTINLVLPTSTTSAAGTLRLRRGRHGSIPSLPTLTAIHVTPRGFYMRNHALTNRVLPECLIRSKCRPMVVCNLQALRAVTYQVSFPGYCSLCLVCIMRVLYGSRLHIGITCFREAGKYAKPAVPREGMGFLKILNWELSVNNDIISSTDNIERFEMYAGGNRSPRRKPTLSERVTLPITWGMGLTGNRIHDLRGDRRWC